MIIKASNLKSGHSEIKRQVDLLYQAVSSYSKCKEFKSLLQFCAKHKHLSPYNAMLVQMQRPDAQYVLGADEWKYNYNRLIKSDARPLIILVPFGPVDFVFDIKDTEPVKTMFPDDIKELLKIIDKTDSKKQLNIEEKLQNLINNLSPHGIAFGQSLLGGDELGAQIELFRQKKNINVMLTKKTKLRWDSYFLLSINEQQDLYMRFAALCKELSHLFCHHLPGYGWWESRNNELDLNSMNFEAQCVTWLVCERQDITNPSTERLTNYLQHHKRIPDVSLDFILQAANEIEKMLKPMNYQKGLLYKKDEKFREAVRRNKEKQTENLTKKTSVIQENNYKQGELF